MKHQLSATPVVQCQVCGQEYLRITRTHLARHDLTFATYVEKFGANSMIPSIPAVSSELMTTGDRTATSSKLTEQMAATIYGLASKGYPRSLVCDLAGISEACLHEWLKMGNDYDSNGEPLHAPYYYDFYRKFHKAEGEFHKKLMATVTLAAIADGNWKAALALLERRYKSDWSPTTHKVIETKTEDAHKKINMEELLKDPETMALILQLTNRLGLPITIDSSAIEEEDDSLPEDMVK